ncbi:hypothetical protein BJ742DRAFT_851351 [Cladochytrium replicatum]|nr:hypothetical protein BJ742DRAFT_851351 [Cladochytrium replicatum]
MNHGSTKGFIPVLDWWKASGLKLKYDVYPMDAIELEGSVAVLDCWRTSGLDLKYSSNSMKWKSCGAGMAEIEWIGTEVDIPIYTTAVSMFFNGGLALRWTEAGINQCWLQSTLHGRVEVLEWWKSSGLEIKYPSAAMDLAILLYDRVEVTE